MRTFPGIVLLEFWAGLLDRTVAVDIEFKRSPERPSLLDPLRERLCSLLQIFLLELL